MRKLLFFIVCVSLLLSGCTSHEERLIERAEEKQLREEEYNRIFQEGYEAALSDSFALRDEWNKGYNEGYDEGYADAEKELSRTYDSGYESGYRHGYDDGWNHCEEGHEYVGDGFGL